MPRLIRMHLAADFTDGTVARLLNTAETTAASGYTWYQDASKPTFDPTYMLPSVRDYLPKKSPLTVDVAKVFNRPADVTDLLKMKAVILK